MPLDETAIENEKVQISEFITSSATQRAPQWIDYNPLQRGPFRFSICFIDDGTIVQANNLYTHPDWRRKHLCTHMLGELERLGNISTVQVIGPFARGPIEDILTSHAYQKGRGDSFYFKAIKVT